MAKDKSLDELEKELEETRERIRKFEEKETAQMMMVITELVIDLNDRYWPKADIQKRRFNMKQHPCCSSYSHVRSRLPISRNTCASCTSSLTIKISKLMSPSFPFHHLFYTNKMYHSHYRYNDHHHRHFSHCV